MNTPVVFVDFHRREKAAAVLPHLDGSLSVVQYLRDPDAPRGARWTPSHVLDEIEPTVALKCAEVLSR